MDGVLDKKYAQDRLKKKYLQFRYKERALVAASTINKYLRKEVENGISLVDFGSAEGATLLEISKILKKGNFIGIEYNQSLINSAYDLPINLKLIQGDIKESMLEDESANAITTLAVLEHIDNPLMVLNEAKRILKPGGIMVATAPVPAWDSLADKILFKDPSGDEHHVTKMNRDRFIKLSKDSDMELVEFFYFMWAPIGFLPYLKIPVSEKLAWKIDAIINKFKIFNWSFVNQCAVFKKKINR